MPVESNGLDVPGGLWCVVAETGDVYHLSQQREPVCSASFDPADHIQVYEAEERGFRPCENCFLPEGERELPDADDEVLVALANQPQRYHADREGSDEVRPRCNYGPVDHSEQVFVTVRRPKADRAGLEPCTGCFGAAAQQLATVCPLCHDVLGDTDLPAHLRTCEAADKAAVVDR